MVLSNSHLNVLFEDLPFPTEYSYNSGGETAAIKGVSHNDILIIDGKEFLLCNLEITRDNNGFIIETSCGYKIRLDISLADTAIKYKIKKLGDKNIEYIDFTKLPFLTFSQDYSYSKENFRVQQWHSHIGRGLRNCTVETGEIIQAFPQLAGTVGVHGCGFNGSVCAFVQSDYAVEPLFMKLNAHTKYCSRSESFSLGLNRIYFNLKYKVFSSWGFSINFVGDINGDGIADECDYQVALRSYYPKPLEIYKECMTYKVMCAVNGSVMTTFKQVLDIVKYNSHISKNAKQIVYLVGWQYKGHDTGYPSFFVVNDDLGTHEELVELINICKNKYNTTISIHVNVDDAYMEHPGWRDDIISKDVDGSLMKWEVFGNRQSYHINHTKDVESGYIFERLEKLLEIVPVIESIHIDAMRNTNYSWEKYEFIGGDKELYCGIIPILDFLKEKGIDVTTESLNGTMIEIAGIYNGIYHNFEMYPVFYHNTVIGGGNGTDPVSLVVGSNMNDDFTTEKMNSKDMLNTVVMYNFLYQFLLGSDMINHKSSYGKAFSIFSDGTVAKADNNFDELEITNDGTLIADMQSRFIPLEQGIYIYQTKDGLMKRKLPNEYTDRLLRLEVLTEYPEPISFDVDNNWFKAIIPANTLVLLQKA